MCWVAKKENTVWSTIHRNILCLAVLNKVQSVSKGTRVHFKRKICFISLKYSPLTHHITPYNEGHNPGGGALWNRYGWLSEVLNLSPKGDHLGVAQAFCDPLRRPIWLKADFDPLKTPLKNTNTKTKQVKKKIWLLFLFCVSWRLNIIYWCCARNTLRKTKMQNLHP